MPNMSRRSIHSNVKGSNQFLYDPSKSGTKTKNVEEKEGTKVENYTVSNIIIKYNYKIILLYII